MCVVSMVTEHYIDKWGQRTSAWPQPTIIVTPSISQEEVDEFRKLLDRAREYDKRNNEPDCELADKKKVLMDLAEQLGVKIDFL